MSNLLAMTIAGSMIVGLLLLLQPITSIIFPARWHYRMGKMAIAFFLVPISLFAKKFHSIFPHAIMPSHISGTSPMAIPEGLRLNGLERHFPMTMEKHLSFEGMQMMLCIWVAGAIVFATWQFYCYRRFIKRLRVNSIPAPENTDALLASCQAALKIPCNVRLMQNSKIASPMLVGLFHPVILLPTSNMREVDLRLILTHELMHLKRKDLWVKMFALAAGVLLWFNPFLYILRKNLCKWSELSCDEVLATEMSHGERKLYGEAILNTLDVRSNINTTFCSSFCESKKHMERRLSRLLNVKKTKKHTVILAVVAILVIGGTGVVLAAGAQDIVSDKVNAGEMDEPQQGITYMEPI